MSIAWGRFSLLVFPTTRTRSADCFDGSTTTSLRSWRGRTSGSTTMSSGVTPPITTFSHRCRFRLCFARTLSVTVLAISGSTTTISCVTPPITTFSDFRFRLCFARNLSVGVLAARIFRVSFVWQIWAKKTVTSLQHSFHFQNLVYQPIHFKNKIHCSERVILM